MAEVIGSCSTLPGALHSIPKGTRCDTHPGRPAAHRVQGETDSFGAELNDMCLECYEEHKVAMAAYRAEHACGACEWCGCGATDLRDRRDFEEGMSGRVYRVCGACVKRQNDELAEEASEHDDCDCEFELDSMHDGDDSTDDDYLFDEPLVEGPELPIEVLPPPGSPRAYVDGVFIY